MTEWISIKDALPKYTEYGERYLVYGACCCGGCFQYNEVFECVFREEGVFEYGTYDCPVKVTHWMPLPKPPVIKDE